MSAMANFSIPTSNIPAWAQDDADDRWKDDLLNRIRQRQVQSSQSDSNIESK